MALLLAPLQLSLFFKADYDAHSLCASCLVRRRATMAAARACMAAQVGRSLANVETCDLADLRPLQSVSALARRPKQASSPITLRGALYNSSAS